MSGARAISGFRAQALVAALDALSGRFPWDEFTIEPSENDGQDYTKVDLRWKLVGNLQRHVQVKSTQVVMKAKEFCDYAQALSDTSSAQEKELIVVGQVASFAHKELPFPQDVNARHYREETSGLLKTAAQELGRFCQRRNVPEPSAIDRERIAKSIAAELLFDSADSKPWSKAGFEIDVLDQVGPGRSRSSPPLVQPFNRIAEVLEKLFDDPQEIRQCIRQFKRGLERDLPAGKASLSEVASAAAVVVREDAARFVEQLRSLLADSRCQLETEQEALKHRQMDLDEAEDGIEFLESATGAADRRLVNAAPPIVSGEPDLPSSSTTGEAYTMHTVVSTSVSLEDK